MNTTANGSNFWSCSSLINLSAWRTGEIISYSLILVVSLIGNSLIGLIVYKKPTMRKPINYLITNMAMSDLLFTLFVIPLLLSVNNDWLISGPLGLALCKLWLYLPFVSYSVSGQSHILIAVDRLVAVVFPLRSPLIGRKWFPLIITATWIVALTLHTPVLVSAKVFYDQDGMFCGYFLIEAWPSVTAITYTTIVLLVILYSIILIKLKLQAPPGEQSTNVEKQRKRRNKNVLRMGIVIFLAFSFCYVPHTTAYLIMTLNDSVWYSCSFYLFTIFAHFMYTANCAVNPFICLIFSSNYRQGLRKLLKC
ncbi:unnamed protein product [Porites evermanni]|uniref:G-protein coupled receptors family 1 profile domain-containing protein n=1 Tax=Porites evermanni TaxID=104178 RepID=A0ABN8R4P3_9CNID|nr:unnamed protein product [Porites evermanni]